MLRLITRVGREGRGKAQERGCPDRVLGQGRFWVRGGTFAGLAEVGGECPQPRVSLDLAVRDCLALTRCSVKKVQAHFKRSESLPQLTQQSCCRHPLHTPESPLSPDTERKIYMGILESWLEVDGRGPGCLLSRVT